jgi:hypothetical protein
VTGWTSPMRGEGVLKKALILLLCTALPATAGQLDYSQSDFGGVGLMQNPTARFADEGTLSFGLSTQKPYNHIYASLQLLPWLETTLRYTEIENRLFGPPGFSGDQTAKDRGVDFKLRLLTETHNRPQLAVGLRDIGGTGLFGSEYVVANKRFENVDVSLGMGWGRLGARGDARNPFTVLSDKFETRPGAEAGGGSPDFNRWFRGERVALFGGLEWWTPWRGLRVKLEYEGNDYTQEASNNNQEVDSPVNLALLFPLGNHFDVSLGVERGNTFMANLSTHINLQRDRGPPKVGDPIPAPVRVRNTAEMQARLTLAQERELARALEQPLREQGYTLRGLTLNRDARSLQLWYSQGRYRNHAQAAGRVARVLTQYAPDAVESFTLVDLNGPVETHRITLARADLERVALGTGSVEELRRGSSVTGPRLGYRQAALTDVRAFPEFSWDVTPKLRQHIGGPDGFYFGQLWLRFGGDLQLTPELSLSGALGANVYNNFDDLQARPTGALPRVRSEIVNYLKEGENNVVFLEANYIWSPAPEWYARLSAGLFEEMYGGVAGELLYKPYDQPWALGANLNHVWQREFDQRFDFRDYDVTTAHATLYYELPYYDILAQVSVGRYLARDLGTTLDFSREFANGVRAGAFATFTNVSSADFGEGRFDKGFYLSLPLDLFFTRSTRQRSSFVFKPLTKDGGQKVRDGQALYGLVEGTERGRIYTDWPGILD